MNNIIVYSKPNCQQCRMVKNVLQNEEIAFIEKDISVDNDALNFLKTNKFMSVPVVFADGLDPIVGFQPEKLKGLKI